MAPAVPFALLGVVQLSAVATWLGLAAAACFPALRRRTTPVFVIGALAMAGAEAATSLRFGSTTADSFAVLRLAALALLALALYEGTGQPRAGTLPGIVVPLGAGPAPAIAGGAVAMAAAVAAWLAGRGRGADRAVAAGLAVGLGLTGTAVALADPARSSTRAALALLAARGAGSVAFIVVLVLLARQNLLGKVVGAIVAGVVTMAVGAVAVVGIGVADQVQGDQSQRLLSVAQAQHQQLDALATRAGLFAKVVALCPTARNRCAAFLRLFASDADYFAVVDVPNSGVRTVAPNRRALSHSALVQLAGSSVVRGALRRSATNQTVATGPLLLGGSRPRLAMVAAVPGRPSGASPRSRPSFAAVYGITIVDSYLDTVRSTTGYDVSVLVNGRVLASSLGGHARRQVVAVARAADVRDAGPAASQVLPATGDAPTVAFVPVTEAGNDNVRAATLAVSQPASVALAAQRSVLRRLVITALVVLVVVAVLALLLARRIADPVRRLTVAAGRVRRGDLETAVSVGSRDEVGVLARAFDEMTSSLRGLTGELREAAEQESALRLRLETVVGSMTDGLIATDGAGLVTGANPTALALLGVEAQDEVLGRPLSEVVPVRMEDGAAGFADVPERTPVGAALRRSDGTELPVRIAVAPLGDGQGRVVVLADRSREREVERMKTEFLANVSHELRTPLTPIRGYAELLSRRSDLTVAQSEEFLGQILSATARMHRVVELLVDVASLEAGRMKPHREQLAVGGMVDDRLRQWRSAYPRRAADLKRRLSPRLPRLDVDPVWLGKALDELVDNAVKYTPAGSPITIAASADGDVVRIAVRDAGYGLDVDRLGELLDDFSQADASQTRSVGGMGLGLGFVRRVADQLGLTLRVASRPGHGSEFALDVPAVPDTAASGSRRRRSSRR